MLCTPSSLKLILSKFIEVSRFSSTIAGSTTSFSSPFSSSLTLSSSTSSFVHHFFPCQLPYLRLHKHHHHCCLLRFLLSHHLHPYHFYPLDYHLHSEVNPPQ